MESPFKTHDARFVLHGAAIAAVAGLLMGAGLRPNLHDPEVLGPQQLVAGGGPRLAPAMEDAGLTRYAGRTPDYVIGTDYIRAAEPRIMAAVDEPSPAPEAEVAVYTSPEQLPVRVTHAAWRDEPHTPPRYPSDAGGAVYESDLPPPPDEPEDSDLG